MSSSQTMHTRLTARCFVILLQLVGLLHHHRWFDTGLYRAQVQKLLLYHETTAKARRVSYSMRMFTVLYSPIN